MLALFQLARLDNPPVVAAGDRLCIGS